MDQSFSPECLNYLESVFSLPCPIPSPPLSYSFTNLVPVINFNKLKIKKLLQNEDKIIPELHLTFLERFPALSMINENMFSIENSENGKIYTSIYILQSICPPFLENGEYFEIEILSMLINLLSYSRKIAPNFSSMCNKSFGFLYEKCVKHSQSLILIPNIINYVQNADEYPLCWFNSHILYLKNILSQMISNPSPQMLLLASTLITTIAPHFTFLENKWNDDPEVLNELYECIYQFSETFPEKHPHFSQNQNYLDLKQSSIKIGLELNRLTDVQFKQYLPIIIKSIQTPIFSEEEMNLKIKPFTQEIETNNNFESESLKIIEKQNQSDGKSEEPLKLDSFSPPKVKSFHQILISINHPILKYHEYLFSCLSNHTLVSLIKLIISEGQNLILNGNYILQTYLFYELSNLKNLKDISNFIKQKNKKSIFFNDTLFNPALTIFNHPESEIHTIRSLIYRIFNELVDESTASFYIPIIADYLNKFIQYPEMFTEFYYFAAPVLCRYKHDPNLQNIIFRCISREIQSLYEAKAQNLPHFHECQILTFSMTNRYIESVKNQNPQDFLLSSFLSDILFMIFENSISEIIFNLIEKYFAILSINNNQSTINSLIEQTFPALDFFISHIELCNHQCSKLLYILFQFLCSLQPDMIEPLKKTSFFVKIRSFFTLKGIDIDSLAYALTIDHLAPEKRSEAQMKELAEFIEGFEMTDSMYKAIMIVLSHNNEPFTSIANQSAINLIPAIIKSKFCLHFLQKIYKCLLDSVPDRILFSELGLAQHILSILKEDTSKEIWEIVLDILKITFAHSTRRNDLLAFFRLFTPVDNHTQTKHAQQLLSVITILLTQNEVGHRSIIRFTTRSGLIHVPHLLARRLQFGFTISYRIMISNFNKPSDSITLFRFNQANMFIKATLYQARIVISSSLYDKDIFFDYNCTLNKWFVLSISFGNRPDEVAIFADGTNFGTQYSSSNREWIDFTGKNNTLFGNEGQGFVECHFSKAAIFINSAQFQFLELTNNENLRLSSTTYFLIDSEMAIKGQIPNISQYSPQNCEYKGQLFSSITTFNPTFYNSKGVSFFITLFSQIDYDIPSTNEDPNIIYFYQLLDLISVLIQMSDFAQQKMYEIRAFEVIAHFMNNSKKIKMNFETSNKIFAIQPIIRNENLRSSFVRSILLNFPLWMSSPISTLKELFKAWRISNKFITDAYSKELRPPVILNVLMKLYETNRINDEIKEILFEILMEALTVDCHSSDIAMIISVMHMCQNNPNEIISYLEFMNQFIARCPPQRNPISLDLVKTEWITLYPDPEVKTVLINYFLKKDIVIFIQYILKNIESAFLHEEKENEKILLECCCAFTGIKGDSIQSIVQNFSSASFDSNNSCLFTVLLGYSLYSSDQVCEQLSKLLLCIFSQKEGIDLIRDDESKFNLFLLVSFLLLKSQNRIDFMVELVSSDPSIFINTLTMIDLYMHICLIEYHQVQTHLCLKVIQNMFSPSFKYDPSTYINVLTYFVCFHVRIKKKKERQTDEINFHNVLENCRMKSFALPQYSFFMYKINEKWADFNLVLQLLCAIPSDKKIDAERVLILLSFLCHPINSKEKLSPLLSKFLSLISPDSKSWIPVIYQVSKHPKDFEGATDFLNTFKQKLKLSTELFDNFTEYFKKFGSEASSYVHPFASDKSDVGNAIRQSLAFDSKNEAKTEAAIAKLRKNMKDVQHGFESKWNKLHLMLSYHMSPFFKNNENDYYKRGNYFDFKLRPSILARRINKENEAIKEEIETLEERKDINKGVLDNVFNSKNNGNDLYHCRCIRVNINKTISGTFYFNNSCFRFVTDSFKVKQINTASITHFFWAASPIKSNSNSIIARNSIQIFLNDKHCYLFTFPNDDVTQLISKGYINRGFMSSIQFFQENEPDLELDRLQLTRKWGNLEISNFDYILWLNILSGRSFLNKNAYPVFPKVFEMDNEAEKVINFSNHEEINSDALSSSKQMISNYLGSYEPFKSITASDPNEQSSFNIPPELYFNELFFADYEEGKEGKKDKNNRIIVPKWAKTNANFLYENRLTLESGQISTQIHIWINKVFGRSDRNNSNDPCIPSPLFSRPHLERKWLDRTLLNKIEHISLSSLNNSQIIDFVIYGQSINNAIIYILLKDGSIFKASIDSRLPAEKIETIANINRSTASNQYLFCYRNSSFLIYSFEKKRLIQFSTDQTISKVSKLAASDEYLTAGCTDGSVLLWNLNLEIPSISSISSSAPSSPQHVYTNTSSLPIPLRRKRASTSKSFMTIKRASSKEIERPQFSEPSNDYTSPSPHQSNTESDDDFLSASPTSSSIFDLPPNTDTKSLSSPLAPKQQLLELPCSVVLVHTSPVVSLQISALFGVVLSADNCGLLSLSMLPSLELCRTIRAFEGQASLRKAVLIEGYGCIVALGKVGCRSSLASFSMNGQLNKKLIFEDDVVIVDVCGIVGSVSGFDFVIVADNGNDIAVYDANNLQHIKTIYHFNEPIKKIKYSQPLSLLMVFFEAAQDGQPSPPAILSYIMN